MNHEWKPTKLSVLLKGVSRPVRLEPTSTYRLLGAHWYAKGLYVKEEKKGSEIRAETLFEVKEGDFVYNRLFAWKGSFAVGTKEVDGCFVSNEFPCFAVQTDLVYSKFLWLYFSREMSWNEALGLSTGSTPTSRNRLKEAQFLNMEILLPSLSEQLRIVSRIEQLAEKVEEAQRNKQQAIAEATSLYFSLSSKVFDQVKENSRPAILGEITRRITKGESPEWQGFSYQDDGPVFVRSENVLWGRLDLADPVHIPPAFHAKLLRSQLERGDVLINLVGASIGRSALYCGEVPEANVNQAVAVITPCADQLDSRYLMSFLNSGRAQEIIHGGKVETARPNISLGDLRALSIPLPPPGEQRRIVHYLDDLQAKVDILKDLQSETAVELDALMPSILSKAFHGEL